MLQPWMVPADLAPGDAKSTGADWTGFDLHRVRSIDDPHFAEAFDSLWQEFGTSGEMETRDIIAKRLARDPASLLNDCALEYELLLVKRGKEFVAVRDHTVILCPEHGMAVVHMSHNLVAPTWRRSGISGWMRALPIGTARKSLAKRHLPATWPIYLVAEMEHADPANEARAIRLKAYERGGYRKVDPAAIDYLQPDFRPPQEIDASGGPQPLPLSLMVREVAHSRLDSLPAATVRRIIACLYHMYGADFRAQDMDALWMHLSAFPRGEQSTRLIAPTDLISR
ncbi:MAG TPA: hypothetical protein VIM48_01880 [Chthoniobacterales bacterium]